MSALTTRERDQLEEVFLSIHGYKSYHQKNKIISLFIILKTKRKTFSSLLKDAKTGLKETLSFNLFNKKHQKKKRLSK
jgi:hypothetical protein